jgi:hypothetical protein
VITSQIIEIRDAVTGALVSTCRPSGGWIRAIALNNRVLVSDGIVQHIDVFSVADGSLQHAFRVPETVAPALDMASAGMLFRAGLELRLLDPASGARQTVARWLQHGPVGFSIEGRRIIWAINAHGHGAIRMRNAPAFS